MAADRTRQAVAINIMDWIARGAKERAMAGLEIELQPVSDTEVRFKVVPRRWRPQHGSSPSSVDRLAPRYFRVKISEIR